MRIGPLCLGLLALAFAVRATADEELPARVVIFATGHRSIPRGAPVTGLDHEAYSQDLIDIVARTAGLKYRIVEMDSWTQIDLAFQEGEVDVIPTIARIPEREKQMLFSVPHVRGTLIAAMRTGEPVPASDAAFAQLRLAAIPKTLGYHYLLRRGWTAHVVIVDTDQAALEAVAAGRADATIINEFTGISTLSRSDLKNRVQIAMTMPDSVTDFCMAVRIGDDKLLAQLNDALFLAEQRGEIRRNFEKWFLSGNLATSIQAGYVRWAMIIGGALVLIAVAAWASARYRLRQAQSRNAEISRLVQARTQELAEANRQLQFSEEVFSKAFRASPDAISITRVDDGTFLDVNDGFVRITGFERGEIIGRTGLDLGIWATPADRERVLGMLHANGNVRDYIGPYRRKGGEFRTGSLSLERIKVGGVDCLVMIARDVTERERAERALRDSETRFRALVESAPEAIVVFEPESGRIRDANENALRMFGATREGLLAGDFAGLAPAHQADGRDSRSEIARLLAETLNGGAPAMEWTVQDQAGRKIAVELRLARLPAEGRTLVRASLIDITERKKLEDQLRHAQRMESIGRLAGGVAHDFNNILTVIQCNNSLLLSDDQFPEAYRDSIRQISQSATFAAGLTRQLLVFSRKQIIQRSSLNLAAVIGETSRLLRRVIGEDVVLEVKAAPNLPPVHADQGMVEQVLLNLAVNARDAMPRGGRLTIAMSVARPKPAAPRANGNEGPARGDYVCIAVSDTGNGIPPEILPRIFEPFFTTKEVGKGTGLGLATVYGIVQQHQGWVEVDSAVGQGTEFRVFLPCAAGATDPAAAAPAGRPATGNSETILVVEDDAMVRSSSCLILQRSGYRILEASSPQAALELWAAHQAEIDLVFTDIVMPGGMTGRELADRLRLERTELKVLFTSGYSADVLEREFVRTSSNFFLQKPFGAEELVRSIRDCLSVS